MGSPAAQYFQQLFSATPYHIAEDLFYGYPSSVTDEDNSLLSKIPEAEEILAAIKSLDRNSAPRPRWIYRTVLYFMLGYHSDRSCGDGVGIISGGSSRQKNHLDFAYPHSQSQEHQVAFRL